MMALPSYIKGGFPDFQTSKLDNFADRALSIDPWPAYATERINTDTQILRDGNRLIAQSKEQSSKFRSCKTILKRIRAKCLSLIARTANIIIQQLLGIMP